MTRRKKRSENPRWVLKFSLAACSVLFTFLAVALALKLYAMGLGIKDPDFRYENQIEMWRPDPVVGYRNKSNFDGYCAGNIHVTTNQDGFRGQQAVSRQKAKGTTRIIGLGDSVMWGTSVNQQQSFLGLLQSKLEAQPQDVEVINAGVVGYSTIQEVLYLRQSLLSYEPDILLVNFCENDLAPSEDPFNQVRQVYANYLLNVTEDPDVELTAREKELAYELIQTFQPMGGQQPAIPATLSERIRIMTHLCLLEPARQMIRLTNQRGCKLIFLFIPPREPSGQYAALSQALKNLLNQQETEYLDFGPLLRQSDENTAPNLEQSPPDFWTAAQRILLPNLREIRAVRHFQRIHESQDFIDSVHPSQKGNELIAQRIYEHLISSGTLTRN